MKIRKTDILRLRRMLIEMMEKEMVFQSRYGDRVTGSVRAKEHHDAEAIRRILEVLDP